MTTRQTSLDAYTHLVQNGKLARKNAVVYEYLYVNGATTQKECEVSMDDKTYTIRPRFAQLKQMGLIHEVGKKVCPNTGKKNILWDVTDRVYPLAKRRNPTAKELTKCLMNLSFDIHLIAGSPNCPDVIAKRLDTVNEQIREALKPC